MWCVSGCVSTVVTWDVRDVVSIWDVHGVVNTWDVCGVVSAGVDCGGDVCGEVSTSDGRGVQH